MRDLASVVSIETKNKMFEKDKICVVTFKELGYEAIVPVSVNVGDKMVFIQEGSILPEVERWEFLRKRCYVNSLRGFLIRPMTMGAKDFNGTKGDRVKSWGLCVTLAEAGLPESLKVGTDVTDKLGIRKYETTEDASPKKQSAFVRFCMKHKALRWLGKILLGSKKKTGTSFPTDIISKSDETTIQNYKAVVAQFPGTKAFITAKMEGQSFTCSLDKKNKNAMYVCSRNNKLRRTDDSGTVFYATADRYDIEKKLKAYLKDTGVLLVIQGEQVGPGIQSNIYDFDEHRWFVFRMKGLENGAWVEYNYDKMITIAKELGLDCVPLLETVEDMSIYDLDSLVKRAEAASWVPGNFDYEPAANDKLWKTFLQHEGIVVKSADYDKELGRGFSFKVKNLAYQEHGLPAMNALAKALKK